jgi:hypothetical protein
MSLRAEAFSYRLSAIKSKLMAEAIAESRQLKADS